MLISLGIIGLVGLGKINGLYLLLLLFTWIPDLALIGLILEGWKRVV